MGAIVGYPTITEKNNMYNTCIVTIRDFEGALYASWQPRDFTPIIICESYTDSTFSNIIFQGFVVNKKFSAKAMILFIAGFSILLDWVPFDANYILAQGKIKSDPIPASATLAVYDDDNENNQYDGGEDFTWSVDQWIGGSRDNGLLIVDNTSGTTSKVWSCSSILDTAMDNDAGNCASLATRDDDDEYYAYETDNSGLEYLDGDVKVTMTGTQIADSNYLQKIELDIKFGIRLVGNDADLTAAAVSVELIPEYNGAFNNDPIAILKHNDLTYVGHGGYDSEKWFSGKLTIVGTNAELAKYLTKDGANYDQTRFQLRFGIYNRGVQSWMNGNDDKWCYIYIDYASLEIFYNTLDAQPIMESITDSAASTITCAGVDWSTTGIATNDIFYIGENTNQILSDLDGLLPIEIEIGSTLSKYIATHFKGITCMEVLKAICNLEGLIWCEDHEELKIKVLKPGDFVDSEVDLDQDDYEDDWEVEDKCNQVRRVDVYGRASYNIHAIAIDTTVSGYQSKMLIDETIMTNSMAQEVADTQLALFKDKRPSIRIPLNGYRTDLKLGYTVDITMSRPTIAKTAYPIRMIERHRRGISGIQTIVYAGLGESSWDEILAKQIRENTHTAHRTQSDRLISTPWSAGANISYGDVVGFGTGVRDIIDAEIVDGESIDAAIDALIATHHAAGSTDHDDRYYTETETDAFKLNKWVAPDGNINMNSKKFTSLVDPADNQDSATKKYVDDAVAAVISDAVYDADNWNGVNTIAPSKNAVRDVVVTLAEAVVYKGTYTPGDAYPANPENGDYYVCDADGYTAAPGGADNTPARWYELGDWIIWNNTTSEWDLLRNSQGDNILSVAPGDNIQTAIDEIENTGDGIVYLLPGTHTLTASLTVNNVNVNVIIRGAYDATIIDCNADRTAFEITNAAKCVLEHFKIDATDLTTANLEIIDITEANDNQVIVDGVSITGDGTNGYGIEVNSDNCIVRNCNIDNINYGINLIGTDNIIRDNICLSNNTMGIHGSGASNQIQNNICDDMDYGVQVESNCMVIGNKCSNCVQAGIQINGDDNVIVGNKCRNNDVFGIFLNNADNNVVVGNVCNENNANSASNGGGITNQTGGYNIIVGNSCCNNVNAGAGDGYGIRIITGSGNQFGLNTCTGNDIDLDGVSHTREIYPGAIIPYDGWTAGDNNVYWTNGGIAFGKDSNTNNHYVRVFFQLPTDYVDGSDVILKLWWFDAAGGDTKDYDIDCYYSNDASAEVLADSDDSTWAGAAGAWAFNRETITLDGSNLSANDLVYVQIQCEDDNNVVVSYMTNFSLRVQVNTRT